MQSIEKFLIKKWPVSAAPHFFPEDYCKIVHMKTTILSLCCMLLITTYAYAQPAISFSGLNFDFTRIGQEDQVEHVFEFTNTGDQELVIDKLQAS